MAGGIKVYTDLAIRTSQRDGRTFDNRTDSGARGVLKVGGGRKWGDVDPACGHVQHVGLDLIEKSACHCDLVRSLQVEGHLMVAHLSQVLQIRF